MGNNLPVSDGTQPELGKERRGWPGLPALRPVVAAVTGSSPLLFSLSFIPRPWGLPSYHSLGCAVEHRERPIPHLRSRQGKSSACRIGGPEKTRGPSISEGRTQCLSPCWPQRGGQGGNRTGFTTPMRPHLKHSNAAGRREILRRPLSTSLSRFGFFFFFGIISIQSHEQHSGY